MFYTKAEEVPLLVGVEAIGAFVWRRMVASRGFTIAIVIILHVRV